jgi:hypothetical protein
MLALRVDREGDRYSLNSHTVIAAPLEAVFDVLVDYDRLDELSSVFEETRIVERTADDMPRIVYLRARGCVLFFCQTIERYEALDLDRPREIVSRAVAPPSGAAGGASRKDADAGSEAGGGAGGAGSAMNAAAGGDGAPMRTGEGEAVPYARSRWELHEEDDGTHVVYAMEMEPSFWVPPVIGPWALKRKLASRAGDAADRLEQRARGERVSLE